MGWLVGIYIDGEGKGGVTFCPSGSRDSPAILTQPRFMPPALGVWIAYSAFWDSGELKNDFDFEDWLVCRKS